MSSIIANILLALSVPLAQTPAPTSSGWLVLAVGPDVVYEILSSSVEVDIENKAVQFQLRSTFEAERTENGIRVKSIIEPTLLLCAEDVVITTGHTSFDLDKKQVLQTNSATVYRNKNKNAKGTAVTELLNFGCKSFKDVTPPKIVTPKTMV